MDQVEEKVEATIGSGNVFRDLGFAEPEAELAKADARLAEQERCEREARAAMDADDGWEWMVVEVMGHRRHAGRVREVERFGAKLMRVDVPNKGDPDVHGWTSHFYPPASLFGFMPAERETVLAANKPYERPAPLRLQYEDVRDRPEPEVVDENGDDMPF